MQMRIGHGFDVHQLVAGRALVLGGVTIQHSQGLAGHSDADVLLHAVCDACIGAAGWGDIGAHFPPTDARYRDADSREFVRAVREKLAEGNWRVGNVDCTLVAQRPQLAPYVAEMKRNIAEDLGIAVEAVNVKATTTEGLGFCGREEGIAAHAVVVLVAG